MRFIRIRQQLPVASAVTVRHQPIRLPVRKGLPQPPDLLGPVTIRCRETPRQPPVRHLDFRAQQHRHSGRPRPRPDPPVDRRADDAAHIAPMQMLLQDRQHRTPQQVRQALPAESLAARFEARFRHAPEKVAEDPLLGLPVGIQSRLHRQQQRRMTREPQDETPGPAAEPHEGEERVPHRQRPVEVESNDRPHDYR